MSSEESKSSSAQPVNQGRRRFARAGVAAPAVLGTLASQPVLATTSTDRPPYHCTISGQLSGSTSRAPDSRVCNQMGRSPGYWKNNAWPSTTVVSKGYMPNGSCNFSTQAPRGTFFDGFIYGGQTLTAAFRRKSVDSNCRVIDRRESDFGSISAKATMLQVLNSEGGLNDTSLKALGRATVATILNGIQWPTTYPVKPERAIKMFNDIALSGSTLVAPGVSWNENQVKTYFESLYGGM